MHDPQPFEARLGAALGRYADQVSTEVDAVAFVRATREARAPRRLFWRQAPRLRLVLVLGILLALAIAAAALVGALPRPRLYSGVFTPTGSLAVARSGHHATLLRDGRVLITGGEDDQHEPIAAAELYDPATGTFSETGQLTKATGDCCGTGFEWYAITPLADGRALVVGGANGPNPVASAELYDPRTGTFTPAGPLLEPRRNPTATLLQDGRVLVAGGSTEPGSGKVLMTAELYDPATATFAYTGSSGEHVDTATLLLDGRVLVTGKNRLGRRTAELYDPKSGIFTPTGPPTGNSTDTASAMLLPDGRVLFTSVDTNSDEQVIAEVYDPVAGTFASTSPPIEMGRNPATALLQDGRVLILGGDRLVNRDAGDYGPLASAELYDPQTGTLTPTASLNEPRWGATATLLMDGRVLVAGGAGWDNGLLDSAELYR